ncbi:MAG: arginine--tRNA ligase [Candidatus Nanoarchaeia archaeon]|nr:arginine--tRNA ligase [Candidatus Nanoarchaeia archaeon]MDD5239408.1 arginine--tRNA ligase [Candidatus Nanoarchaeia archaeon]
MNFNGEVLAALKKAGVSDASLEAPKNPEFGDLSFACFKLGGNPVEHAKTIAAKIQPSGLISKVVATGPYVNFYINNAKIIETTVMAALKKDFGAGKPKGRALVEHTSINPNASPHVGRARNALLGDSIVRILKFYGYNTETHYFVNDIGKQIAMLVYAVRKNKIKKFTFDEMLNMYIKINADMITNATVEKDVFELLNKLEKGDRKTTAEFQKIVSIAVKGQLSLLNELGIKYDVFDYESSLLKAVELKYALKKLNKKLSKDSEGRRVLDLSEFNLPMKEPVLPITRANGTSLYALRDIAYHIRKAKKVKNGKNVIILGEDHKLEHLQIKSALSLMKIKAPEPVFYSFILLSDGKMSTRKGNVVLLKEFMDEAVEKARQEILKRNAGIKPAELEKIAKAIGYSAIKYAFLKVSPDKNIIFNWEEALNFEGNSAPYILYTAVRAKKILEKIRAAKPKHIRLENPSEIKLVKKMAEFPNIVSVCAEKYVPHVLANYIFELASCFSEFYEKCRVTDEPDADIKNSRALLVKAYLNVITKSAGLLGMSVPEFM